MSATFAIPRLQPGTFVPRIEREEPFQITAVGQIGPYTIFSIAHELDLNVVQVFGGSLDVEAEGLGQKVSFFKLQTLLK